MFAQGNFEGNLKMLKLNSKQIKEKQNKAFRNSQNGSDPLKYPSPFTLFS
jgi:hypothetical protein